jgi:diguanylate cyclase (GGDEF)-like protein/PAS domain S-box-containing protein
MGAEVIRVLFAEDDADDQELEIRELRRAGLRIEHRSAFEAGAFSRALKEFAPHIVISDFRMPGFDGMEALRLAGELAPDTPFIFVSGTLGEDYAVRALKNGATDYVLKSNLIRLPASVERAIQGAQERRSRREAQEGLRRAQLMARLAHVITGPDGAFESWSDSLPALVDLAQPAMIRSTREWMDLVHPADRELFRSASLTAAQTGGRIDVDYRLRRRDGTEIHVRQSIEPLASHAGAGQPARWFSTLQDISEQKQASEAVQRLTNYDALTGLANRTLLMERLGQGIAATATGRLCALALLDIERFKTINDSLGRAAGDALLARLAERLVALAGDASRVARPGADQFAVMIPDVRSVESVARAIDDGVRKVEGEAFEVGGTQLRVAIRSGIAVHPHDAADADTLFRNAEAALKKAKQRSEKYLFYAQEMTERVAERLSLENKLRLAVERQEFVLHYQPKVDLEERRIVGVEALIRWQSAGGLVPPLQFIGILEETGMIAQVGAWALQQAVADHRAWRERGLQAPRVAVNVSAIQLRHASFVSVVEQALGPSAASAGVDLEITESLLMDDVAATIATLKAVRALGIDIAIDDFGTGYSSLAYLTKLPVQALKIDRSFVINMDKDPNAMTLVSTIISLAHSLRLKVIAEGVESESQANTLRLLRCDAMQGYLISKPVPAASIESMLAPRKP